MVDFESVIEELIELSPNVAEYISSMRYLMLVDSVDSITESLILNSCYNCIIEDLENIGVLFHVSNDDLISNHFDMKCIIWLYRFLKPNNFMEFVKVNDTLIDFIDNEVDGIGDNEVIVFLLQKISLLIDIKDTYIFLSDKIYSSSIFVDYIRKILKTHNELSIKEIEEIDGNVFKEFISYYKSCMMNINSILQKSKELYWYSHSMESYFEKYFMNNIFSNNSILSPISKWYYHTLNIATNIENNVDMLKKEWKEAYKKYAMMSEDHALYYKVNNTVPTKQSVVIMTIVMLVENAICPLMLDISYKKTFSILNGLNPELTILFEEVWNSINKEMIING